MVKLNKIYTKTGDKGSTQLGNGKRVEKNSLRVDAYGYVDEANAAIGLSILRTNIKIKKILQIIQNDLFDLGADLCIPDKKNIQKLKITNDHVDYIEGKIDTFNKLHFYNTLKNYQYYIKIYNQSRHPNKYHFVQQTFQLMNSSVPYNLTIS